MEEPSPLYLPGLHCGYAMLAAERDVRANAATVTHFAIREVKGSWAVSCFGGIVVIEAFVVF